ncbi:hypothetical protein L226DRAFT_565545 [Lentinus tigrinus ALCF2SS1-7]|uniref:Uncharacterized protein n=1 Tax=Lentinus tigrinus ALCF2SS1-6 TaxID=1328759 RepID=A0A5C2STH6_9APHY|nr:hypothetical protein L227DRAFT_605206 [Lentinus tigrinus ALCF2SS1-6]RPD80698.1 hypothetical protein L226DRAFT_565545 [Lentinus tigrinus ALCF2SS1-7]
MPTVVEWDSGGHGHHRHKVSTIHGWVTKLRGTILRNKHTRHAGIREMEEARALRIYKREHPEEFRRTRGGGLFWFIPGRNRSSHSHHHHHDHHDEHDGRDHHRHRSRRRHEAVVVDDRGRRRYATDAYYGERHHGHWLRFDHRVRPHHHGCFSLLMAQISGDVERKAAALHHRERVAKERRRERRRRKRQRRDEALAVKIDCAVNKNRWWRR